MRYALKQLNELTTADLGSMMMPSAGARVIRRQGGGFHRDSIAKLAQYCKAIGQTRPNLDALELIAKRIETGKLVLIRIPAPLASGVVSPKGSVNHLLPAALGNKVHELAQLALVEDIDSHIKNENSMKQSGGHSSAPAVIAAASAASAAPVASRTMANAAAAVPVKETITLHYKYTDGQPIEDIPYVVNHAGDVYEGNLASGSATIPDVVKGSYSVEYKAVDDAAIVALRAELKTNLQGMISEVKVQAKYQEDLIDKEGYVTQGLIYTGAFMTGLYEGGASIVSALVEVVDSGADFVFDVGAACWRILGCVATGDLGGLRSEFENIAANSGEAFDKIKNCFKTLYIIAMDPESRGMVAGFPKDYFDAHSSVEKTRLVGTLAFEIILALATYGVSVAVSAIAKSKYFAKAGQAIQDITKHIKLEKLNHKRDGMTNDDILDEVERIDDELVLVTSVQYKVKEGVNAFEGSPVIFKRQHKDGQQGHPDTWPDSYTLMPDGKPMGATAGEMPAKFEGIKKLPLGVQDKMAEGWPDLIENKDFVNFTDLEAVKLKKDTTIYRIIDEGTSEATKKQSGGYWALELPNSKTEWRKEFAVKDSWNDNGHYIKHILEEDTQVWKGGVAGQAYEEVNGKKFYLQGNNTQILVKPKLITGDQIKPRLTNWKDAI
jgi:hypothetical protein